MIGGLQQVLVRRPDHVFGSADPTKWHYASRINLNSALQEHDDFVKLLHESGSEVIYHDVLLPDHADAIFVHDPSLVCDQGAILLSMGKELRRGEEDAQKAIYERLGIPIHFRLYGSARGEAGDMLWLDERTLMVGLGFRTNIEAVLQLREALPAVDVLTVDLPYDTGPEACLHLMSYISLLDRDLAVAYLPPMGVAFYQLLQSRGISLVEVGAREYATMATNVLAVEPRDVIMLRGNPVTEAALKAAGCRVRTYKGDEISLKAEGGATCLTRPILRT